jgi:hypothetical protein
MLQPFRQAPQADGRLGSPLRDAEGRQGRGVQAIGPSLRDWSDADANAVGCRGAANDAMGSSDFAVSICSSTSIEPARLHPLDDRIPRKLTSFWQVVGTP